MNKSAVKSGTGNADVAGGKFPRKSRLKNPLNVVVEKIGATRAMVHGDVSVESLKELLMSSLALLPTTKDFEDDKLSKKGEKSAELAAEEEAQEFSDEKRAGKENSKAVSGPGRAGFEGEGDSQKLGKTLSHKKVTANGKSKSKEPRKSAGTKTRPKSKLRGINDEGKEGEEEENEEADGPEAENQEPESLASCSSLFDIKQLPISCDGRWLRMHFENSLVQGLKEIAKKRPQDPVGYLAFWLRNYRRKEEEKRRKTDFENGLKTQRQLIAGQLTEREDSEGNLKREIDYCEDEEGGGHADWNFQNY